MGVQKGRFLQILGGGLEETIIKEAQWEREREWVDRGDRSLQNLKQCPGSSL